MGNFGDGDNSKRNKSRGGRDSASILAGLGSVGASSAKADWGAADPKLIAFVLVELSARGGLLSLGLSRDGGAFNVTLLVDGDRRVVWISGSDDIDAELEKIGQFLASLPR